MGKRKHLAQIIADRPDSGRAEHVAAFVAGNPEMPDSKTFARANYVRAHNTALQMLTPAQRKTAAHIFWRDKVAGFTNDRDDEYPDPEPQKGEAQ